MDPLIIARDSLCLELKRCREKIKHPWCLVRDCNAVQQPADRNKGNKLTSSMRRFNAYIEDCGLIEIQSCNHRFTWCNSREVPSMSKIDSVFADDGWESLFPHIEVTAQPRTISDHSTLIVDCDESDPKKRPFKLEKNRLQLEDFSSLVNKVWRKVPDQHSAIKTKIKKHKYSEMQLSHGQKKGQWNSTKKRKCYWKKFTSWNLRRRQEIWVKKRSNKKLVMKTQPSACLLKEGIKWRQRSRIM